MPLLEDIKGGAETILGLMTIATAIREQTAARIKAKRNNKDTCWLNYRVLRNKGTRLIKSTKSEHYLNLIN